ncbi:MAG: hypothetical protein P1V81_15345 [Planctomycetota bacterium]|nr:hypothetical protein [Planctomycetota bacterium]
MRSFWGLVVLGLVFAGCGGSEAGKLSVASGGSCMTCHNAGLADYEGPGIENPHPFGASVGADNLDCTTCHGGDDTAESPELAHVPPPPEIGDRDFQDVNRFAYFNRLTLTGLDKLPDYEVAGVTHTALDYLQFINPGDLRVTEANRSCGTCHGGHSDLVAGGLLATEAGILSGAMYAVGDENRVPGSVDLWEDTAADVGFRAVADAAHGAHPPVVGEVGELLEFPVWSGFDDTSPDAIRNNDLYASADLHLYQDAEGKVLPDSPLARLYAETTAFTCGDCHLGSAGANNRYGDFRSSGCTACHMPYSLDGRSGSSDPNINKLEPANPDAIKDPEQPHVRSHRIVSVAKAHTDGTIEPGHIGMDDYSCAGCHQGSNRTVMQYWGIRLDQNQDVKNHRQYPADPVSFQTTSGDERLFDPEVGNNTFNGRNRNQYLLAEDYDGDGRDDTPMDVHYEAGLGCIDCHGSHDLHGGDVDDPTDDAILSRMEQAVAIRCESCHGTVAEYAPTVAGTNYLGEAVLHASDSEGNPLKHVVREDDGGLYLYSRLDGAKHFVPQTRDVTVDTGVIDPRDTEALFSELASYAMGRTDGLAGTGMGPLQVGDAHAGFSHMDTMDCASCHSSWTNNCIGCHLEGEYTTNNNNFSNITGERSVYRLDDAQFVYQSPVPFQLGVGPRGEITGFAANSDVFWQYEDKDHVDSGVYSFSDRNGGGKSSGVAFGSLSHNAMLAHSIRGKVTATQEGPRYCTSCHLTTDGLEAWGEEYDEHLLALSTGDFGALDFELLKTHIGSNPGNQLDSPLWVPMVAGLGSGLFLFDVDGGPVNKIDDFAGRVGAGGVAPKDKFDPAAVAYDLDRMVDETGAATGSNTHVMLEGPSGLRAGAPNAELSGPLGAAIIQRLTDPILGIVLDAWITADGTFGGGAGAILGAP